MNVVDLQSEVSTDDDSDDDKTRCGKERINVYSRRPTHQALVLEPPSSGLDVELFSLIFVHLEYHIRIVRLLEIGK